MVLACCNGSFPTTPLPPVLNAPLQKIRQPNCCIPTLLLHSNYIISLLHITRPSLLCVRTLQLYRYITSAMSTGLVPSPNVSICHGSRYHKIHRVRGHQPVRPVVKQLPAGVLSGRVPWRTRLIRTNSVRAGAMRPELRRCAI